ncbi:hypothetical protein BBJ28_00026179, partial [Nothophytophthora sp. Chile5]
MEAIPLVGERVGAKIDQILERGHADSEDEEGEEEEEGSEYGVREQDAVLPPLAREVRSQPAQVQKNQLLVDALATHGEAQLSKRHTGRGTAFLRAALQLRIAEGEVTTGAAAQALGRIGDKVATYIDKTIAKIFGGAVEMDISPTSSIPEAGQLALGTTKRAWVKDKRPELCFPSPTLVEAMQTKRITRVSCGAAHTVLASADGQLFTFGCGDGGCLGFGNNDDSFHPQLVVALEKHVVLDACCDLQAHWSGAPDGASALGRDRGDGGLAQLLSLVAAQGALKLLTAKFGRASKRGRPEPSVKTQSANKKSKNAANQQDDGGQAAGENGNEPIDVDEEEEEGEEDQEDAQEQGVEPLPPHRQVRLAAEVREKPAANAANQKIVDAFTNYGEQQLDRGHTGKGVSHLRAA